MGQVEYVYLGLPGIAHRFWELKSWEQIPEADYHIPVFTLNKRGDIENLAAREGFQLHHETLEYLKDLPAQQRWNEAIKCINKGLADVCLCRLNTLNREHQMPTNVGAPIPSILACDHDENKFSRHKAMKLLKQALSNVGEVEGVRPIQIDRAADLVTCLRSMNTCFCKLPPNYDYEMPCYVLPGDRVNEFAGCATLFFVNAHL